MAINLKAPEMKELRPRITVLGVGGAGGIPDCWDDPAGVEKEAASGSYKGEMVELGWMLWPPIPYRYNTINNVGSAPSAPDANHWLGTDDTARDVLARVIYGFRLSILFALIVSAGASVLGIAAGAVQAAAHVGHDGLPGAHQASSDSASRSIAQPQSSGWSCT